MPPRLDAANEDIFEAWELSQTQWRRDAGLDYSAVFLIMETLDIDKTRANIKKIQALELYTLKKRHEKQSSHNN